MHKGAAAPLVGGAGSIAACQRFLLAGGVLPAWGDTLPPRLAPWGKREKGIKFLADAGYFCHAAQLRFRALCNQFSS